MFRRSKMEMYISTLEALTYHGPLKRTKISYKAKIRYNQLVLLMDDLIKKRLIEERKIEKNTIVYATTPKARRILAQYKELKEMLPLSEEERKTNF
jgi:predicted transcriptional regulator